MTDYDRTDRVILEELQKNARISFKELAARTGVAPSTCLERVRGLRARGVIAGFHARLDLASLGRKLEAMIAIRFRTHARELVDPFVEYLLSLPETVDLFNVAGDDDYLLHVAVADTDHLHELVLDRLGTRPEVERLRTALVYAHYHKASVAPLGSRDDDGRSPAARP